VNLASSGLRTLSNSFFATLFPSDCRICSEPLANISRLPVCPACIAAIRPISGDTCEVCGERLESAGLTRCCACLEHLPPFARAVAFGAYDGELRELIHLLKYDQVLPAAVTLGAMLARAIEKLPLTGPVVVVPVPLHSSKRRQRGFNQSELIARSALKLLKNKGMKLEARLLSRTRPTASQIGLTRPQRAENIRGAFQVVHLNKVSERSILLVDDVLTTGTTAAECARVLRKAGAASVWVATVARTLKNQHGFEVGPELEFAASA
jgi:ComF family protein